MEYRLAEDITKSGHVNASCRSVGAELGWEIFFERGNNSRREVAGLRVGQRCFAALKRYAHEQRILSGRNIFPAKQIRGLDGCDFADVERANRFDDVRKRSAVSE